MAVSRFSPCDTDTVAPGTGKELNVTCPRCSAAPRTPAVHQTATYHRSLAMLLSVLRRLTFNRVDDQHFHGSLAWLQPQPVGLHRVVDGTSRFRCSFRRRTRSVSSRSWSRSHSHRSTHAASYRLW